MQESMVDGRMRVELTVAAPAPSTASERARFEAAMQDVSYVAGGVTTRAARGWWHEPLARALHPMEPRVLVIVVTSPSLVHGALRVLAGLCQELGDSAVLAWCSDVSIVHDLPDGENLSVPGPLLDPDLAPTAKRPDHSHHDHSNHQDGGPSATNRKAS